MTKKEIIDFFNRSALERDRWKKRNSSYYHDLMKLLKFIIPEDKSVIEIGCGTGDFVAELKPKHGVGIDFSNEMICIAQKKYPSYTFLEMDAEQLKIEEKFNFIIMSDLIGHLEDVQKAFKQMHKIVDYKSRIVITYFNFFWEPILRFAEIIGLKMHQHRQNWLNQKDIENLLELADFEVIKQGQRLLIPFNLPIISKIFNQYLSQLPILKHFCIYHYIIARKKITQPVYNEFTISVIIPARNEKGNIENAVNTIPRMGKHLEIIFVEGHSTDGTLNEIIRIADKYKENLDIKYYVQDGKGKGDAVRKGFSVATGDILCILDADLTMPPENLPKFYEAISSRKGEFINGSRLVYPMEKQAMRYLNMIGNKFFSMAFTWLLGQRFKDTLCGTKVIFRKDYEDLSKNRSYFGDFDPFGDFDLIFGASKLNLKIVEIPIRYRERVYGITNISRFKHGLLLLRMCWFAMKKIKFI